MPSIALENARNLAEARKSVDAGRNPKKDENSWKREKKGWEFTKPRRYALREYAFSAGLYWGNK